METQTQIVVAKAALDLCILQFLPSLWSGGRSKLRGGNLVQGAYFRGALRFRGAGDIRF